MLKRSIFMRILVVATGCLMLSGCATLTIFSYMDKGFYADHGKGNISPVYDDNESCAMHGTCEGVNSCDVYGNC